MPCWNQSQGITEKGSLGISRIWNLWPQAGIMVSVCEWFSNKYSLWAVWMMKPVRELEIVAYWLNTSYNSAKMVKYYIEKSPVEI